MLTQDGWCLTHLRTLQEEYSIITLELGSGKMYLYFFPSQYTAGFKIRVLGVESLL
jgi:hypothetical protein